MSMITELVGRLRESADDTELDMECSYACDGKCNKLLREAADVIEELSTKLQAANMERSSQYYNGGWIPCSERLPEESGAYLVWMIWGDEEPTYSIINFDADYNEFGEWTEYYDIKTLAVLDREFRTYIDVFAWMPLPQPYKAERSDVEWKE